ncbi:isochorismatase-like protein [Aureococcus anophagefferens]|nr:isochorismatase-like protein [Aureococcus anophagefferens]KAH8097265.1 isochorismatase-like protein [Aureococcus anophagefferens]
MGQSMSSSDRVFSPAEAKGDKDGAVVAAKTAVVFIEFQNEFAAEEGKMYGAVKESMEATGMLEKAANVAKVAREKGCTLMHAPISFAEDGSDNPNKKLGILNGCFEGKLFLKDTWNSEFVEEMTPAAGDVVIKGKKGLDAFPGTDLEAQLKARKIETVVLCGFLTNCCVESTMRTAFEKGFNTITLTDCCATTSADGHRGATEGTFGLFSSPMTAEDFLAKL